MLLIANWALLVLFILAALGSLGQPLILVMSVALAVVFGANIRYIKNERKI